MLTPGDARRQALSDQRQPSSDNLTVTTYRRKLSRSVSGVGFRCSLRQGRRAWADESVEAPYPGRGQRPGHRTVVPLARYDVKQLVVVHHREHRHRRGDQAERPVVVPATSAESEAAAVDRQRRYQHRGFRLGTGGGYYDRALGLVAPTVPVLAVVYDDELLDAVPSERHDRPVTGALTPSGVRRFH